MHGELQIRVLIDYTRKDKISSNSCQALFLKLITFIQTNKLYTPHELSELLVKELDQKSAF